MRKTVLLVDDDAVFQEIVGDALREAGYAVAVAGDGVEALKRVREVRPDFIVLDLIMPKRDAIRTCKTLKRHPRHRRIPIIILTGLGREGLKALRSLGAEGLVAKRQAKVTCTDLLNALRSLELDRREPCPQSQDDLWMAEERGASELAAEPPHLQTLLATIGEGVVEMDEHSQVVYVNRAGLAILGRTEDEILGSPGSHLLGAAGAAALDRGLREAREQGEGHTVGLELPSGMRTIGVTLMPMHRLEEPMGILVVLQELPEFACRLLPTPEDHEVFRL